MQKRPHDYAAFIMQRGTERIKQSHPDATDFRYLGTKGFVEGRLTKIQFHYDQPSGARTSGMNYIYDDGEIHYFRNGDDLVNGLGSVEKSVNFSSVKSLFLTIIVGVFIIGVIFVVAGIWLVSLGAAGNSHVSFFGLDMTSENVGIISIAFGALVIILIVRSAMKHIQSILSLPEGERRYQPNSPG